MKVLLSSVVWVIGIVFTVSELAGLQIGIAPMAVEGSEDGSVFSQTVADTVNALGSGSSFGVFIIGKIDAPDAPRSILDAADWCGIYGLDLLVYGAIRSSSDIADGVIRVFDAEKGTVVKALFGRDESARTDRLIEDLAKKLYVYFSEELNLAAPVTIRAKEHAAWDFSIDLGWWSCAGSWNDALTGLCSLELGGSLTPIRPILYSGSWDLFLRFGLNLGYETGMRRPGHEEFFFQGLLLKFPIDICAEWRRRHQIRLTGAPLLYLDMIVQNRLYTGNRTAVSAAGGLSLSLSYIFRINDSSSLGLSAGCGMIFYSPVRIQIRPALFYEFSIPGKKEIP